MSQYKKSLLLLAISALLIFSVNAEDCGTQNPNGKCNASAGECCSKWGYCGVGDAWCGAGCQAGYGTCSSTTSTTSTSKTTTSTSKTTTSTSSTSTPTSTSTSTNGRCGNGYGTKCPSGQCCSQWSWCGTTSDYCAAGCQSGFGKCNSDSTTTTTSKTTTSTTSTTTTSSTTTSTTSTTTTSSTSKSTTSTTTTSSSYPTSTNSRCGKDFNTQCASGQCCSQWGCSTTTTTGTSTSSTTTSATSTATSGPVTAKVYTSCSTSNTFALTFDDGPYAYTNELLDTLANNGIKATFFVNGNNWGCIYDYADVIKRAYDAGHQIASHTWSHPSLPSLSDDDIRYQITAVETALRKIIGAVPRYFRLPYGEGATDSRVLGILGELGYSHIIQWDIDSGDATGNSVEQSEQVYRDNANSPNPHLALNHDVKQPTVEEVVPFAIDLLKGNGYNLVTVGSCLGSSNNWYKEVTTPSTKDSSWTC
ncbi:997_t:CDS:2 [Ambispora gerdemannii]|uniref:997_t:CDS:1 n=1 Tax=Ambispora gerdemannii TaxID=144530 RepID=A0A9N9H2M7_9GLOM|nr:997_t:CDS:2 [Ambispora gerdemannii]